MNIQLWRVMVCAMGFTVLPMLPPPSQGAPHLKNEMRAATMMNQHRCASPCLPAHIQDSAVIYYMLAPSAGCLSALAIPRYCQFIRDTNILSLSIASVVCLSTAEYIRRRAIGVQYKYYDTSVDDAEKMGGYRLLASNGMQMGAWLLSCIGYKLLMCSIIKRAAEISVKLPLRLSKACEDIGMVAAVGAGLMLYLGSVMLAAHKFCDGDMKRYMHKKELGIIKVKSF